VGSREIDLYRHLIFIYDHGTFLKRKLAKKLLFLGGQQPLIQVPGYLSSLCIFLYLYLFLSLSLSFSLTFYSYLSYKNIFLVFVLNQIVNCVVLLLLPYNTHSVYYMSRERVFLNYKNVCPIPLV